MSVPSVIYRVALPYDVENIREELGDLCLEGVSVYIDEKNKDAIEEMISSNPRKCERALGLAMQGEYMNDIYGKEKISEKTSHMTAIKYKGKLNYRIYCQELTINNKKVIVMCVGYHKKVQKAKDTKTTNIIESASKYSFIFK